MTFKIIIKEKNSNKPPMIKLVTPCHSIKAGSRCIVYHKDMRYTIPSLGIHLGNVKSTSYTLIVSTSGQFSIHTSRFTLPFRCHWSDSELPSYFLNTFLELEEKLLKKEQIIEVECS